MSPDVSRVGGTTKNNASLESCLTELIHFARGLVLDRDSFRGIQYVAQTGVRKTAQHLALRHFRKINSWHATDLRLNPHQPTAPEGCPRHGLRVLGTAAAAG